MCQSFNGREGINNWRDWPVHPRIQGAPAQAEGPLQGTTIDLDRQMDHRVLALGWDPETCKVSRAKLMELGLDDVARDLLD